jgi:hypothetical protein
MQILGMEDVVPGERPQLLRGEHLDPAKIIDGTVLRPGQKFEWWSAVGPVTPSRGFGPGGFIAGNHAGRPAPSAAACSSSTTLFNAALRAGRRWAPTRIRKYYIHRYRSGSTRPCRDARRRQPTMSFTNDAKRSVVMDVPLHRGRPGWVRYEIWGIRTAHRQPPRRRLERPAGDDLDGLRELAQARRPHADQYPADGMDRRVASCARAAGSSHSEAVPDTTIWNGIVMAAKALRRSVR